MLFSPDGQRRERRLLSLFTVEVHGGRRGCGHPRTEELKRIRRHGALSDHSQPAASLFWNTGQISEACRVVGIVSAIAVLGAAADDDDGDILGLGIAF